MSAFMTAAEVAERWQVDPSHVRRLARRGELVGMRIGVDWRFSLAAVEAYEAAHTTKPAEVSAPDPKPKEVSYSATVDGFTLPADYEPVFKDLWPGHEATPKRKAALSSH